mgnify:FL=1
MNDSLRLRSFPKDINKGIISLLPKIKDWAGEIDKLRPITLLNVLRKIYEALLMDRITKALIKYPIMTGTNFGFTIGKGTAEPIFILKNIIDIFNKKNQTLYYAILDVQQAYDSVPIAGIQAALRRKKFPQQFIDIITDLHNSRELAINTAYGPTDNFQTNLGIPQGGILSTFLWNIFYDPLLNELEKRTTGIQIGETFKLSAPAFADDLHPMAETITDLQKQLDIITEFLTLNEMKMGISKTWILTNREKVHEDFPSKTDLKIGGQFIENIKEPHELSRILGVQLTMNSDPTNTLKHAMNRLNFLEMMMNKKSINGLTAKMIINAKIIPTLNYLLQTTPISETFYKQVDTILRRITKSKLGLPRSTPDRFLYDNQQGIGILAFKEEIEKQTVSNYQVFARSKGIVGLFFDELNNFYQNKNKLTLPPLEIPHKYNFRAAKYNYLLFVSNILYENDLSLSNKTKEQRHDEILLQLNKIEYQQYHKEIRTTKLTKRSHYRCTQTNRERLHINNQDKLLCWNSFRQKLTTPLQWYYFIDQYPPMFFQTVNKRLCLPTEQDIPLLKDTTKTNNNQIYNKTPPTILPDIDTTKEVNTYTDGSAKTKQMGSGAVYSYTKMNNETNETMQLSKPPNTHYSSTTSEQGAILAVVENTPRNLNLKIYTDSQSTINSIETLLNNPTEREILKIKGHATYEAIAANMKQFDTLPQLIKIKAHSGDRLNEKADAVAKRARETVQTISEYSTYKTPEDQQRDYLLYHNNKLNDIYPREWLKQKHRKQRNRESNNKLKTKFHNILNGEQIDHTLTNLIPTIALERLNQLDPNNHRAFAFIINLRAKNLQTADILLNRKILKLNTNMCHYCLQQHNKEEIDDYEHFWTCQFTISRTQDIYENALNRLLRKEARNDQPKLTVEEAKQILNNTGLKQENFFNTPESRGILTEKYVKECKRRGIDKQTLTYTIACILIALCQEAWNPRSSHYQKTHEENIKEELKKEKYLEKQRKSAEALRKRNIALDKLKERRKKKRKRGEEDHEDHDDNRPTKQRVTESSMNQKNKQPRIVHITNPNENDYEADYYQEEDQITDDEQEDEYYTAQNTHSTHPEERDTDTEEANQEEEILNKEINTQFQVLYYKRTLKAPQNINTSPRNKERSKSDKPNSTQDKLPKNKGKQKESIHKNNNKTIITTTEKQITQKTQNRINERQQLKTMLYSDILKTNNQYNEPPTTNMNAIKKHTTKRPNPDPIFQATQNKQDSQQNNLAMTRKKTNIVIKIPTTNTNTTKKHTSKTTNPVSILQETHNNQDPQQNNLAMARKKSNIVIRIPKRIDNITITREKHPHQQPIPTPKSSTYNPFKYITPNNLNTPPKKTIKIKIPQKKHRKTPQPIVHNEKTPNKNQTRERNKPYQIPPTPKKQKLHKIRQPKTPTRNKTREPTTQDLTETRNPRKRSRQTSETPTKPFSTNQNKKRRIEKDHASYTEDPD